MKRFLVNAAVLVMASLILSGCSANETELYEKWENDNRQKWEQEAESVGYDKGYEEGFKDGETEERLKYEEKEELEEEDWNALLEQEREDTRNSIRKYADEYNCLVWDDLEDFDFTIDLQRSAIKKRYVVEAYPTDLFLNSEYIVMKAIGTELPDLFYLKVSDSMEEEIRKSSYLDCAFIIEVESVSPIDIIDDYVSYSDVIDEEIVRVGDAYISYDLGSEYRLVTGTCEEIIPID